MPTVSVIVPVYNVREYLSRCVDSILAQTFADIEVLLIDDGSTDGSGAICDEYAQKDSRVRVFHQENGGVCAARNCGLDEAKGEYYLLCDSDDAIHPKLIEMAIFQAKTNGLDCLIYGYKIVSEEITLAEIQQENRGEEYVELMTRKQVLYEILRGERFRMLACNKLYKADLWKTIRFPVGRKFGDDTSVTYKLMDLCQQVGYVKTPYYYYCMRPGSALHSEVSAANLQLFDAYDELVEHFRKDSGDLLKEAYTAYAVRVFDFLSALKKSASNIYIYIARTA